MYILFLILITKTQFNTDITITTQEFDNIAACTNAGNALKDSFTDANVKIHCLPKHI